MACRIKNCRNANRSDPLVFLYGFPKNESLRYAWRSATGNSDLPLDAPSMAVCSLHFREADFMTAGTSVDGTAGRTLRFGAVPTENLPENAYANYNPDTSHLPVQLVHEPFDVHGQIVPPVAIGPKEKQLCVFYEGKIAELERTMAAQRAKLAMFNRVFTRKQAERLFAVPPLEVPTALSQDEVENAVQRYESKGTRANQKEDEVGNKPGDAEDEEDEEDEAAKAKARIIEALNSISIVEMENEAAIDRYLIKSKLLVTKLRTT